MIKTERIKTDILIIGGGTAGCYAALTIYENNSCFESNLNLNTDVVRYHSVRFCFGGIF